MIEMYNIYCHKATLTSRRNEPPLPWVNLLLPMHRPSSLCPSAPSNKEPPSLASGHQYRRMHIYTHTRYSLINTKKPSEAAEPSQSINHINQPLCRCPTPHPQMHSKAIKDQELKKLLYASVLES